jgi:nucleoside triphosphatase
MRTRVTVTGIIRNNEGKILLCKMPINRGVYPGQWAIPGGGIEEGEEMREALGRELQEEVGLEVTEIVPFCFDDDTREKINKDGSKEMLYMIHLIFDCKAVGDADLRPVLNDEFDEYAWVKPDGVGKYDINEATRKTFTKKGWTT